MQLLPTPHDHHAYTTCQLKPCTDNEKRRRFHFSFPPSSTLTLTHQPNMQTPFPFSASNNLSTIKRLLCCACLLQMEEALSANQR